MMKEKNWQRKLAALGMTAIMALSVAGCGNGGGNSASAGVPIPEGLWDPYEQEVVLTTVVEDNSGTDFQNGDTWDDNTWYRAYKDRFNI